MSELGKHHWTESYESMALIPRPLVIAEADPERLSRPTLASGNRERSRRSSGNASQGFRRGDIDSVVGMRSVPQWRQNIQIA